MASVARAGAVTSRRAPRSRSLSPPSARKASVPRSSRSQRKPPPASAEVEGRVDLAHLQQTSGNRRADRPCPAPARRQAADLARFQHGQHNPRLRVVLHAAAQIDVRRNGQETIPAPGVQHDSRVRREDLETLEANTHRAARAVDRPGHRREAQLATRRQRARARRGSRRGRKRCRSWQPRQAGSTGEDTKQPRRFGSAQQEPWSSSLQIRHHLRPGWARCQGESTLRAPAAIDGTSARC